MCTMLKLLKGQMISKKGVIVEQQKVEAIKKLGQTNKHDRNM